MFSVPVALLLTQHRLAVPDRFLLSRSCLLRQRSVVHYVLESWHLSTSSEYIRDNTPHRPCGGTRGRVVQRIPPRLPSDSAAMFRNRGPPLTCGPTRCAPIRET